MSQKFLGIDYGIRKIGTALGFGSIATPLAIYENSDSVIDTLCALVHEERVDMVVVGYPVSFSQKKTDSSHAAQHFADALREKCDIPVLLFDEQLTSKQASRMGVRGDDDAHAASLMLQSFMDGYVGV